MKESHITVNGVIKTAKIVTLPHWMHHDGVIGFLATHNLTAGTEQDLCAYLAQHPDDLEGRCTTALGTSQEGMSPVYDDYFTKPDEKKLRRWKTEQDYLRGCSFIGIQTMKRNIRVGEDTKIAEIHSFHRWMLRDEILNVIRVKNLKVGSDEDVQAYLDQHPEDLGRKRESDEESSFCLADFFTTSAEAEIKETDQWCAIIIIHPAE